MFDRETKRIRHETARRRTLTVAEKRYLTPNYLSITFRCDDFGDFTSLSPDDHVKLFLPGARDARGRPPMRDYTPRSFNFEKGEFVLEFALHDNPGPATRWAIGAKSGETIEIGGPRGSVVIDGGYDWYWLCGDETAIPAIARRLAECPDSNMHAFITVTGAAEEAPLPISRSQHVTWVHRPAEQSDNAHYLAREIENRALPEGDGFIWIAAEANVAKALREAILLRGHPRQQLKAAGYWTTGKADTTERFD